MLGTTRLISIPLTRGWMPIGFAERISVDTFLGWALLTGLALASTQRSKRLAEQAERSTMTIHDLRHTAASVAISAGAHVKAVQKMTGTRPL